MKSLKLTLFALLVSFASFAQIGAISGPADICPGSTPTYTDTTAGGTWSSSNPAIVTISGSTGVATAVSVGALTITYTVGSGYVIYGVTVNPLPSPITGPTSVCVGSTIAITDATPGGTWSSSAITVGSISGAGLVYGVSAGTTDITYAISTGCSVSTVVTVNAGPSPITGPSTVCIGSSITLGDATGGGTWSSSNVVILTVGSTSGVVTGGALGVANISYTLGTGCSTSKTITVSAAAPLHNVTGGGNYCAGGAGVAVGLDGSDVGISYQLYVSGVAVGSPIMGTGTALSFGMFTAAGTYTVIATGTSCGTTMSGSAVITINPLPNVYTITGGGSYCTGGVGVHIMLSSSDVGISYQLYFAGTTMGSPLLGTGTMLDFGLFTSLGVYTIAATNVSTTCADNMSGSVSISVSPLPTAYTVTGGGSYCAGGTGVVVGLANSDLGVSYQLYNGATLVGTPISGSGGAISFGMQTAAGTYTVVGTNATTGCSNNMTGSVTIGISPLPTAYTVTGGGSYCAGGAGVHIGLTFSMTGVNYQLFNGGSPVGAPLPGTSSMLDFGFYTTAGTYTVVATDATTSCTNTMTGSAVISITALPTVTATVSTATCGSLVTLTAGGAVSYSWAPSTGLSCTACGTATTTPASSIVYTVIGTDGSGCTNTATASVDGNNITGHITYTGVPTDVFKVWLIQFNPADSSITSTDSTNSCMDSGIPYFEFSDPAPGNYLVKAKLDGTVAGTSGYIPTYSSSTPYWYLGASDAHTTSADLMDITMVYGTVPPGPGFISGFVYAGAGKGTSGDAPDPGMLVYLKNTSGTIITYTYTDVTGAYTFSGIANGSYIIYPEDYKYYTTPSAVINLTPSNEIINAVDFKRHTTFGTITPNTASVLTVSNSAMLNYYPNPTTGILNIANNALLPLGSNAAQTANVVVSDITGNVVYKTEINVNPGQKYSQVDLSGLTNGVYFINYSNKDVHFTGKLLIMK